MVYELLKRCFLLLNFNLPNHMKFGNSILHLEFLYEKIKEKEESYFELNVALHRIIRTTK